MAGHDGRTAQILPEQSITHDPNAVAELAMRGRVFMSYLRYAADRLPRYDSGQRDEYLRRIMHSADYGLLQGAMAIMVSKAVGWQYELAGGTQVARDLFADTLTTRAELGEGWAPLLTKTGQDFWGQDKGAFVELMDLSFPGDEGGKRRPLRPPVVGVAHLDAAQCSLTRDPDWPVVYHHPTIGKRHVLHRSRVIHLADMSSPQYQYAGMGQCAVSRVFQRARIMALQSRYNIEQLDDKLPAGILEVRNAKWDQMLQDWELREEQKGNVVFRQMMVVESLDPEHPVEVNARPFRQVPDGYDPLKEFQLAMMIFALAWATDVRDFTALSGGALGSARETEVKHLKARGMGTAYFRRLLADAINAKITKGYGVQFKWLVQDEEQEAERAKTRKLEVESIKLAMEAGVLQRMEGRRRLNELGMITDDELRTDYEAQEPESKQPEGGERQEAEEPAYTAETLGQPADPPTNEDYEIGADDITRELEKWRSIPALAPYAPKTVKDIAIGEGRPDQLRGFERQEPVIPERFREGLAQVRLDAFRVDSANLVARLTGGDIGVAQWEREARNLIKGLHTAQTAIGKGGWGAVTQSDWGRVGRALRDQYAYLHRFGEDIGTRMAEARAYSETYIGNRFGMYGDSAQASLRRGEVAAQGVVPSELPAMPGDGSTRCLGRCKCSWEFVRAGEGLVDAYWRLGATEQHCEDCILRADEWAPWGTVRMET